MSSPRWRYACAMALALLASCREDHGSASPPAAGPPPVRDQAADASRAAEIPDAPRSTSPREREDPVVFAYRAAIGARVDAATRARIDAVDTSGTIGAQRAGIEFAAADRAIRTLVALAFESAGDATAALELRGVAQATNRTTCARAMDVLTTVAGRARTSVQPGRELSPRLSAASRAAGDAGNACSDAGQQIAPEGANDVCDDAPPAGAAQCRAAAAVSVSAARAGGAAARTLEAASGSAASREAALVAVEASLRALVEEARAQAVRARSRRT